MKKQPLSDQQILIDAKEKHNINIDIYPDSELIKLIRYVRHIGFNEGMKSSKEENQ